MRTKTVARLFLLAGLVLGASGCYYAQAVNGQLEVLRKREPIAEVIGDPATPERLAEQLRLIQEARAFSIERLGLPDNKSYQTYADLERDYVVWNVFAAPEFSLQPLTWCFPFAGCVAYRGYFKESAARREAGKLTDLGHDVYFGGVTAYSTLGNFNDPILNTMMRMDDVQLVSVLFHELAHQVLYIKGDSAFNESFASAVEEFGVERFLAERGREEAFETYRQRKALRRELIDIVNTARVDLQTYYSETIDDDEKRLLKEHRLERLGSEVSALLLAAGRDPAPWLEQPLNNARIASMVLYDGRLPAFRQMLAVCENALPCFYAEAQRLAALSQAERDAYLDAAAP